MLVKGEERMSIDTCIICGDFVDTDEDCDAYFIICENGNDIEANACRCENHRYMDNYGDAIIEARRNPY